MKRGRTESWLWAAGTICDDLMIKEMSVFVWQLANAENKEGIWKKGEIIGFGRLHGMDESGEVKWASFIIRWVVVGRILLLLVCWMDGRLLGWWGRWLHAMLVTMTIVRHWDAEQGPQQINKKLEMIVVLMILQ
jgi:hypothetical protein